MSKAEVPASSSTRPRVLRRRPVYVPGWDETRTAAVLAGVLLVLAIASILQPAAMPWAAYLPVILLSGVLHSPRVHALVIAVDLGLLALLGFVGAGDNVQVAGTLAAGMVMAAVTMWRCLSRAQVGVQGNRGELILYELRQRIEAYGRMPALVGPWQVEACVRSAFGQRFSGDFVLGRRLQDGRRFEAVLVDVSGKGLDAASRALVLAGGFDALLGALPPEQFLRAANSFVLRQGWDEGFATAVHLVLDLETGEYAVQCAGHPPPVVFDREGDAWGVPGVAPAPALGLIAELDYPVLRGRLAAGDAVLLYSDGLVEDPVTPIESGIGHLMEQGETLARQGFSGGARRLCTSAVTGVGDDRAALLLWSQ